MISIVCPVYNEAAYISDLLTFYERIKPEAKEIFVVDGCSHDRTAEMVLQFAAKNPTIYLLRNPKRFVPFALNLAIPKCKGDIIVRWDAHTQYSEDYLEQIVKVFERTGADIVGGAMRIRGGSDFQKAVGHATSTIFGIGNSSFHYENFRGFTDSVYLGAWKRSVFDKIGMFDEQLLRNQDDEFHYRARHSGLRIYQDPAIKSYYFPRKNFRELFKQYFGYGLFKPVVIKKIKSEWKFRHFVPMVFTAYLITLPFLFFVNRIFVAPLILYFLLSIIFSLAKKGSPNEVILRIFIFPTLHIAYGLGFWKGLLKLYAVK
ncbi:MAG: glycosyltransferase family 2 protein [Flavobacteriales bacterium]|nr:glycosyltransferase family 2 protein [Flavobacteriales bacterium]